MNPTYIFQVRAGRIIYPDGAVFAPGVWSGHGTGRNNPDMQDVRNVGPLPVGLYRFGPMVNGGHLGPDVMALTRVDGGETFGRGDFYVHGAAIADPAMSSDGCIIVDRSHRERMNQVAYASRLIEVRA